MIQEELQNILDSKDDKYVEKELLNYSKGRKLLIERKDSFGKATTKAFIVIPFGFWISWVLIDFLFNGLSLSMFDVGSVFVAYAIGLFSGAVVHLCDLL